MLLHAACKQTKKLSTTEIADMDLDQFADWIIEYETLTLLGAGLIESILITGRAAVWKANSQAEINAILGGLVEQANTAYQQLTGS